MALIRRTWLGLFAAALLVIACGPFSAATAAPVVTVNHSGCGDHPGKAGQMIGCAASCLAIAPVAPAAPSVVRALPEAYVGMTTVLVGTRGAPDPPPPRTA